MKISYSWEISYEISYETSLYDEFLRNFIWNFIGNYRGKFYMNESSAPSYITNLLQLHFVTKEPNLNIL